MIIFLSPLSLFPGGLRTGVDGRRHAKMIVFHNHIPNVYPTWDVDRVALVLRDGPVYMKMRIDSALVYSL